VNVVIAKVRMMALNGRIESGDESSLDDSFVSLFITSVDGLMPMVVPDGVGVGAIPWLLLFPT
jgi:hypothetical protein